jgi:hypothetical protein
MKQQYLIIWWFFSLLVLRLLELYLNIYPKGLAKGILFLDPFSLELFSNE